MVGVSPIEYQTRIRQLEKLNATLAAEIDRMRAVRQIDVRATYTHGTNRFWVYEHQSDAGIFKFWIPHTKRDGDKYLSLQPPITMNIHVEFERDETTATSTAKR